MYGFPKENKPKAETHFSTTEKAKKRWCWATYGMHAPSYCASCSQEAKDACAKEKEEIEQDVSGFEERIMESSNWREE